MEKAVRIKYRIKAKDGTNEYRLSGLIKKSAATKFLLMAYKKIHGDAEYVDKGEDY